jgi:hypothetical protein
MRTLWAAVVCAAVVICGAPAFGVPAQPDPVVIAVIGEDGLNVLHEDFTSSQARPPRGMPRADTVTLPNHGPYAFRRAQAEAGPLGHLVPGRLYRLAGTRIVGLINPGSSDGAPVDVFADTEHGTGVVSAAVGRRHGTAPDAVVVVVLGSSAAAWAWVAAQSRWIDVVSASYFGVGSVQDGVHATCVEGHAITDLTARGRPLFVAAGNGETASAAASPAGHPDAYRVGGVTRDGRTWLPIERNDGALTPALTPNRPYDTGELFSFRAAAPDSLTGEQDFGGTSGAAPRTAGDAAVLIMVARRVLGSSGSGSPALATRGRQVPPRSGPLSDGDLTRADLLNLLRRTARPQSGAATFMVEGYGAVSKASVESAGDVLRGTVPEPDRSSEDLQSRNIDTVRRALFPEARCG